MEYKALILFFNNPQKRNIFIENINKKQGLKAVYVLKNMPLLFRIIRRIHFASNLPGIQNWFTDWTKELEHYPIIICIATKYSHRMLKWIARRTKKTHTSRQIINYYWDEIHVSGYSVLKNDFYTNWSFCRDNSIEFEINYNPQFWVSTLDLRAKEFKYDVSYVGGDRNGRYIERTKLVNQLFHRLEKENIKSFFWYITKSDKVDLKIKKSYGLKEEDFLNVIKNSKVVIELVEEQNQWITQRALYALSNEKKLITNNLKIMDELLYCGENVFVLGYDEIDNLIDFIKQPYVETNNNIDYYELEQWIERFIDD